LDIYELIIRIRKRFIGKYVLNSHLEFVLVKLKKLPAHRDNKKTHQIKLKRYVNMRELKRRYVIFIYFF